ncbi:hypothetical protein CANINC_001995 [Pichia inconspicua]|uniref:J domain-containing protein n=1 Tax=Pichia inconspicua TaxID=52247 RepID=A0A4T0X3L1_9ASCO|nr:hypothetical protein CANINC_001995 [[Candida] inconspicua]
MSQSRYEYDENSETWPYFMLTAVLVPLVPMTLSKIHQVLSRATTESKTFKSVKTWFKPYNQEEIEHYKSSKNKSNFFSKSNIFMIFGWLITALLVLKIIGTEIVVSETNFDPWKILDISETASDKVIKTAYRKLSLKYHPDKVDTSLMTPEEADEVDSAYVLINKAYKALTDEVVKANFIKYGNPDGPNEIKHGIALPKFLIDGPTSPFLVLIYVLLIAIILPLLVSNWWQGVKSHTKQGLHVTTADHFMKVMFNASPVKLLVVDDVLEFVSHSVEYQLIDSSLGNEKVLAFLKSYLNREKCDNEALRLKVVAATPKLLSAFIEIAAAFKNTDYCLKIVDTHRSIIQAINSDKNARYHKFQQILQLPGVDASKIDYSQNILTLGKLLKAPTVEPKTFLGTEDGTTANILSVAKSIPLIEPLECKFKVPGEDFVPPSSSAHISFKFIVKSAAHKSKPAFEKLSKEVVETQFKEEESLENLKNPMQVVDEQPDLELQTLPPYFPDDEYIRHNCGWVAFLVTQRDNKIVEIPRLINKVDTYNLTLSSKDYEESKCKVSTFKFQLQAPTPNEPGNYQFRLVIRNLVYFGSDIDIPLVMKVEQQPVDAEKNDVYGIQDPSEDSLAGAMATMRGQPVKKIEFDNEYDSSDDDEDDDEEEELWTDLDTDTEVEEDAIEVEKS